MADDHDRFMDRCLSEAAKGAASGNVPVGSLIVRDGTILGVGRNRALSDHDPTAHAEIDAIRDACTRAKTTDLTGATCYTTMEPCPMCCWALQVAGVTRLVLGARHDELRRTDYGGYSVETLLKLTNRSLELVTGIRQADCIALRQDDDGSAGPATAEHGDDA